MPEFVLDMGNDKSAAIFKALDSFTQGYIMAAFFTECEHGTTAETWNPETQSSLPGDATFADLAPEALASMIADCNAFISRFDEIESRMTDACRSGFPDDCDGQAGRDFWYTRNGHGCGFWDGDWPEPFATEITKTAKTFGGCDLYRGDDGKIYAS